MSSPRKRGPIRRGGCFERRCSTAFAQQLKLVVMGPRFRRGRHRMYGARSERTTTASNFKQQATPRGAVAPGRVKETSRSHKSEGAGNAGCRLHPQPRVQCRKHTSLHHRFSQTTPHSLRNGFNGLFRAPRRSGFLVTVAPRLTARLDAGVEASGPHDLAVRGGAIRLWRHHVHRIPLPTSVTIMSRPS
jgi:hypothetical protein